MSEKNYFILVASPQTLPSGRVLHPAEVVEHRLNSRYWPLSQHTPNRRRIKKDDECLAYLAGTRKGAQSFSARMTVSASEVWTGPEDSEIDLFGSSPYVQKLGLENVQFFREAIPIRPLLPRMCFHGDRKSWGVMLQGGCKLISFEDWSVVVSEAQGLGIGPS